MKRSRTIPLSKEDLDFLVQEKVFDLEQKEKIWSHLVERNMHEPKFSAIHIAYFFGAMIVISAMGWFMTLAWESFEGGGILVLAGLYAFLFVRAGQHLWYKENLKIPGGLLFTIAVSMTPLAIYGLEKLLGLWPQGELSNYRDYHIWVKSSWIFMEIGTILAGAKALKFNRIPFLTAPIAFSLWYMSMDLTPLLFGKDDFSWAERRWVSIYFGLIILLIAYGIDRRTKEDYAFWGYLFGLIAFSGALSVMDSNSEWGKLVYCMIHLALMVISILLHRKTFLVFGSLGVFGYLAYLSYHVFENSVLFPFALTFLGLLIIFLAVQYQKKQQQIEGLVLNWIPSSLRQRLPPAS